MGVEHAVVKRMYCL